MLVIHLGITAASRLHVFFNSYIRISLPMLRSKPSCLVVRRYVCARTSLSRHTELVTWDNSLYLQSCSACVRTAATAAAACDDVTWTDSANFRHSAITYVSSQYGGGLCVVAVELMTLYSSLSNQISERLTK